MRQSENLIIENLGSESKVIPKVLKDPGQVLKNCCGREMYYQPPLCFWRIVYLVLSTVLKIL